MQQSLSKFFAIKSILYVIAFSILGYLYWTKSPDTTPSDHAVTTPIVDFSSFNSGDKLCFKDNCCSVELATTPAQREQGLMNRTGMAVDHGMLFVFEQEAPHSFWMKNTLIPLDMIWINASGQVVDIQTASPCLLLPPVKGDGGGLQSIKGDQAGESCPTYKPSGSARYVLELNAGLSKYIGLRTGSQLTRKKQ